MQKFFSSSHLEPNTFTASDVDRLTDVRPAAQRDWRRRGLLRRPDGWMRYFPHEIAQIAFRQLLGSLGLPHLSALLVCDDVVEIILDWAKTYPGAVEFDQDVPPSEKFVPAMPSLRYCLAVARPDESDPDGLDLLLFGSAAEIEVRQDTERLGAPSLHLVDCKVLGFRLAELAGAPFWSQRPGPSAGEVTAALNLASRGDTNAQAALLAIGRDWCVPE